MDMVQAELFHPTANGVKAMVAWIPRELRSKEGDQVTAGKDPTVWTIHRQYETVLESTGINQGWKVGGITSTTRLKAA
jgi:hypothetical protein